MMSAMTHHDAQSFEDVELTHGTGAVFVQPRVHAHLMEDMSAGDVRVTNGQIPDRSQTLVHYYWSQTGLLLPFRSVTSLRPV